MSDPTFYGESEFNERVTFHDDLTVYGSFNMAKTGGIILISPNGTKYKLIVANDGSLSTQTVL